MSAEQLKEAESWTSMLLPGYRPAVFDDIPIIAIVTMETVGTGTRYVFSLWRT